MFLFGLNYNEQHHLSQTVANFTVVYDNELVGKNCKQLDCSIQQTFQEKKENNSLKIAFLIYIYPINIGDKEICTNR